MLSIDPVTGKVVWQGYTIHPLMTIAELEKQLAERAETGSKPTIAPPNTTPIPDEFPSRSYPPDKQRKIDADWQHYQAWRRTLRTCKLPGLAVQGDPIDYTIEGMLHFQYEMARELRLWPRLPGDVLDWEVVSTRQEFDHAQLCNHLLETRLGAPHHVVSEEAVGYTVHWSRYSYVWGTVALSSDVDYDSGFTISILIQFGEGIEGPTGRASGVGSTNQAE